MAPMTNAKIILGHPSARNDTSILPTVVSVPREIYTIAITKSANNGEIWTFRIGLIINANPAMATINAVLRIQSL